MLRRVVSAALLIAVASFATPSAADMILMNVDPAGTTSNQTLYDTVLSGGVATWPGTASRYRDYQFELQTSAGTATFDQFGVQLSGQLRNQTSAGNALRASLFSGPIVANPLLASALVTVSTPNSSMTASGYSSVQLTGPSFAPVVISTTPSVFFFRVWAEGGSQNEGYQTKMAATLGEYQSITMDPAPAIDGYIDYDTNNDGTIDTSEQSSTRDSIAEVRTSVPEIDPASAAGALAIATGLLGLLERRRNRVA